MSARSLLILSMPCIACQMEGNTQPNRTEEHHLNLGGFAGQVRRGDEFSIPLCGWHHRAEAPIGYTKERALLAFGPSLATRSRLFRALYGRDDMLLAKTDTKLASVAA